MSYIYVFLAFGMGDAHACHITAMITAGQAETRYSNE